MAVIKRRGKQDEGPGLSEDAKTGSLGEFRVTTVEGGKEEGSGEGSRGEEGEGERRKKGLCHPCILKAVAKKKKIKNKKTVPRKKFLQGLSEKTCLIQ